MSGKRSSAHLEAKGLENADRAVAERWLNGILDGPRGVAVETLAELVRSS